MSSASFFSFSFPKYSSRFVVAAPTLLPLVHHHRSTVAARAMDQLDAHIPSSSTVIILVVDITLAA
jgi:hypothetical protein